MRQLDSDRSSSTFIAVVNEYLTACQDGHRVSWLTARFDERYAGLGLSDGDVIDDLLSAATIDRGLSVAECERCGRLWVQRAPGVNKYASFTAEDGVPARILKPDREG
jgi:hypothetical protein